LSSSCPPLYITVYGAVLIFTGLRIRAKLRRSDQIRLRQTTSQSLVNQQSTTRRSNTLGSRRTLKILTFTSVAYFTFWSPYAVVTLMQTCVSSFQPPSAVQFVVMWLANANSAVNVFIYSSTNTQFKRQCVLLASRLCCSRLSCHDTVLCVLVDAHEGVERSTDGDTSVFSRLSCFLFDGNPNIIRRRSPYNSLADI